MIARQTERDVNKGDDSQTDGQTDLNKGEAAGKCE